MSTRYVLMNFGTSEARLLQAHYCLLSLLAKRDPADEIVLVTDVPESFAWLKGEIRIHPLSAEQLRAWIGPSGYFFRTLIQCIILATELEPVPDVAVYLDTDTIVLGDPARLWADVDRGAVAMDCREYNLSSSRRRGNRALWKEVGDRTFAGFTVTPAINMWNTGITALGRAHYPLARRALAVNDAMLESGCRHFLTEQIALSTVLESSAPMVEVNPAGEAPLIVHYWGNKDGYGHAIHEQLSSILIRKLAPMDAAAYIASRPISLPTRIRRTWWQRLLRVKPAT
ncbi:MAG: hypothetical protein H0W83_00325 [Planctomycetes bacterium]|nr:hypothetical protein [Planctomycetota bacterium]